MAWQTIPFKNSDLPMLSQFFRRVYKRGGTYGSMDLFQWKILDNTICSGIINLIKSDEKIISTTTATPKNLYFKGKSYQVAEIGDTYTDDKFQRQGLFLQLVNQTRADAIGANFSLVYGTPNNQSLPGYEKKANFKVLPELKVNRMVLVLEPSYLLSTKFSRYLSSFLGGLVKMLRLFQIKLLGTDETRVEKVNDFPAELENIWSDALQTFDFVFNKRPQFLDWRFNKNPNVYEIYIAKKDQKTVGYVVTRTQYDAEIGCVSVTLADFLFLNGQEKCLLACFTEIAKNASIAGAHKLETWCVSNGPYYSIFERSGFKFRNRVPVIAFQNDFSAMLSESGLKWHFTISDSDNV